MNFPRPQGTGLLRICTYASESSSNTTLYGGWFCGLLCLCLPLSRWLILPNEHTTDREHFTRGRILLRNALYSVLQHGYSSSKACQFQQCWLCLCTQHCGAIHPHPQADGVFSRPFYKEMHSDLQSPLPLLWVRRQSHAKIVAVLWNMQHAMCICNPSCNHLKFTPYSLPLPYF